MKKNNFTFKMKMDLLRFKYRNKKIAISYILLILLGLIVCLELNYYPSIITHIIDVNKKTIESFKDIYINTGIALIGFSVITITLQTYNQQSRNDYMNSVAEKIFDTSVQNYIYSCYIFILTIIFLIVPTLSVFYKNFQFFYFFYYISILIIFLIFLIELVVIKNSSKSAVLKQIEKTTIYYFDFIEKQYNNFDEYCKKRGLKNSDKVDFVNSWNTLIKSNIQLANSIIRQSINDSLLFANGMDYYINIVKRRLEIRKNKFIFFNIPLITEIMPLKDNDYFIERYILEYLVEYSNLALQNKNRDVLDIIQNVYLKILILGKDNKYSNSNELELTIKVAFSYYIDFIKNLVLFGNENSLISCYDSFKELFINNYKEFSRIVDNDFYNKMEELSNLALERHSLMNFRTVQGLIVLPAYSIIHSKSNVKEYELNVLLNCLKKTILSFGNKAKDITNRDGARIYLEYIFNTLPCLSLINIITEFYLLQIKQREFDDEIIESFLSFISSNEVYSTLLLLNFDGTYTSGMIYCRQFLNNITDASISLLKEDDGQSYSKLIYKIIYKCMQCLEKYSLSSLESNGLNLKNINCYYERIIINCDKLINNKVFNDFIFNNYIESFKKVFNKKIDKKKNFEEIYSVCDKILNYYLGAKNEQIIKLIDWYTSLFEDKLIILFRAYRHLASVPIGVSGLNYDDEQSLLEILKTSLVNALNSLNLLDIKKFIKNNKLNIKTSQKKSKLINCIIEESKNKLFF